MVTTCKADLICPYCESINDMVSINEWRDTRDCTKCGKMYVILWVKGLEPTTRKCCELNNKPHKYVGDYNSKSNTLLLTCIECDTHSMMLVQVEQLRVDGDLV